MNPAPTILDLLNFKKKMVSGDIDIGICVDTEHAYAAGDRLFDKNKYWNDIDMVHLNAIPKEVRWGSHLDRHSITPIEKSKSGVGFAKKIINDVGSNVVIILERTDASVVKKDIMWCRERLNEKNIRLAM
jgi:endonuclease IV